MQNEINITSDNGNPLMTSYQIFDINGHSILERRYCNIRILSFTDIESVYNLKERSCYNFFIGHRTTIFKKDKDYFVLKRNTVNNFYYSNNLVCSNNIRTYLTESGINALYESYISKVNPKTPNYFNTYFQDNNYQDNKFDKSDDSIAKNIIEIIKTNLEESLDNLKTNITNKINDFLYNSLLSCKEYDSAMSNIKVNNLFSKRQSSDWLNMTFEKLYLLLNYLEAHKDYLSECFIPKTGVFKISWIIHLIICQAEKLYNIKFSNFKIEYQKEKNCDDIKTLTFIEYYSQTKEAFDNTLNLILSTANIKTDNANKYKSLIDDIEKIENLNNDL